MRPFTTTLLLLLTSLPTSFSFLDSLFSPQPAGCQYSNLDDNAYIYFTSPNDTQSTFAIATGWHDYYPTALRAALVLEGFQPAKTPDEGNKDEICG
jgi:hypothetical protein